MTYPIPRSHIPCVREDLEIRYSTRNGRGVYALRTIEARTRVSCCPFVVVQGRLEKYTYSITLFHPPKKVEVLALGLGSLFNHSTLPNVEFRVHKEDGWIEYFSTRRIEKDEELCIFYGHDVSWMTGIKTTQQDEENDVFGISLPD